MNRRRFFGLLAAAPTAIAALASTESKQPYAIYRIPGGLDPDSPIVEHRIFREGQYVRHEKVWEVVTNGERFTRKTVEYHNENQRRIK